MAVFVSVKGEGLVIEMEVGRRKTNSFWASIIRRMLSLRDAWEGETPMISRNALVILKELYLSDLEDRETRGQGN